MASPTRKNRSLRTARSTRKVCSPGKILRKAYVRRYTTNVREKGYTVRRGSLRYRAYPKSGSTLVKSACVKDRGLPGKGPSLFGELRKGELLKYGYQYRKSTDERHNALRKAADQYGALALFRKLDVVAKLSKRSAPAASKVFKADRDWVRAKFGPLKA
jgi:Family of unknown function (DUF5771)